MATLTQRVVRRARKRYGVTVLDHNAWGSEAQGVYALRRRLRPVRVKRADTLVQHITVTRPSGNFREDARTVERIGLERFGSGVSYNFLVDMKTGVVAVGQPLDAKGTHTVNDRRRDGFSYDQNHAARAIAVVGMPGTPLSAKAERAIEGLIAAMVDRKALTKGFDYLPHSFFAWKDCPCDATRSRLGAIRKAALARRGPRRLPVSLRLIREEFKAALGLRPGLPEKRWHVKRVQRELRREYDKGLRVTGVVDERTLKAWREHERGSGISGRPGVPDEHSLDRLLKRYRPVR